MQYYNLWVGQLFYQQLDIVHIFQRRVVRKLYIKISNIKFLQLMTFSAMSVHGKGHRSALFSAHFALARSPISATLLRSCIVLCLNKSTR